MTPPGAMVETPEAFSDVQYQQSDSGEDTTALTSRKRIFVARRPFPAPWLEDTLAEVNKLGALEADWDSYGADPVDPASISFAREVICFLAWIENIEAPTVAATPDGEIGLSWDAVDWSLDAWIAPQGQIHYVFLDEKSEENDKDALTIDPMELIPLLTRW